eukprot:596081-Rhodomonas_salina.1
MLGSDNQSEQSLSENCTAAWYKVFWKRLNNVHCCRDPYLVFTFPGAIHVPGYPGVEPFRRSLRVGTRVPGYSV